jgi:hypothetical protein
MTRRVLVEIAAAAALLGFVLSLALPAIATGSDCPPGDSQIQPIPAASPAICAGGEGPATATPTPEQVIDLPSVSGENPWLICPPYTDFTRTLPSGIVECSVSSGETLRYNPTTGQWTDVFIPNTAMEAPR